MPDRLAGAGLAAALSVFVLTACAGAAERASTAFEIHDAWVRPADSGATTAAYLRFVNGSSSEVTVSGFSSDAAATVELHESMTDDHMMMHMQPRSHVTVAPKASALLKPGGLHLMLIRTARPLPEGSRVRLVMRLSTGAIVATMADVRAP